MYIDLIIISENTNCYDVNVTTEPESSMSTISVTTNTDDELVSVSLGIKSKLRKIEISISNTQVTYRTYTLLGICAYISRGRNHVLNNEERLTASVLYLEYCSTCAALLVQVVKTGSRPALTCYYYMCLIMHT